MTRFAAAVVVGLLGIGTAAAQEAGPVPFGGIIDELRGGINAHRASADAFSDVSDLSFDVLFTAPEIDVFKWMGSPRPEIGATINFKGEEDILHGALVWQFHVLESPVYVEAALGAAVHDGHLNDAPPGTPNLGCRGSFYERIGVGALVGEQVTATVTYEHMSNADLCEHNSGISNFGLRLGWKF